MRRRARGQTIVIAAMAMVAVVGAVAMVIDAGMFFVIQRQLQSAADAGALAGAWYDPICLAGEFDCRAGPAAPPEDPLDPDRTRFCTGVPGFPARDVAKANADTIAPLCGGSVPPAKVRTGTKLNRPRNVNTIVVIVECDATYSFGRILGLGSKHIQASSAAAIGNRDATNVPTCLITPWLSNGGDMKDFVSGPPPSNYCGRIARLVE